MSILGINAKKSAVLLAEVDVADGTCSVLGTRKVQLGNGSPQELSDLYDCFQTLIEDGDTRRQRFAKMAVLSCPAGQWGSSPLAVKAEAMAELAATRAGFEVIRVAPQSLKRLLDCDRDVKWQTKAKELLNPEGAHKHWSQGADGAAAAAYGVSTE